MSRRCTKTVIEKIVLNQWGKNFKMPGNGKIKDFRIMRLLQN